MRFGLFGGGRGGRQGVSDSHAYDDYIEYVCEAEELGFKGVFLVEHHFTGLGQISASLNLLTFLAARTTRMRLGTAVVVLPWHNPALLAEQAGTLDVLSNGRLDFGIGRGYRHNEFHGFCIPQEEAAARYEETLEFLQRAWTAEERFSHHGPYWHFEDIVVEPRPVQRPHPPLWVGAGRPESVREAGVQGFNLLLDQFASVEETGQRIAAYRAGVESTGATFDPHRIGLTRSLNIAMNHAEREAAYERRARMLLGIQKLAEDPRHQSSLALPASYDDSRLATEESALLGTPDEIISRLRALQDLGAAYVLLIDPGLSREHLRQFAREVMPAFAEESPVHAS
jgi:alkanesulfonate monooxygenase SsuD/methylene tetrahydromethanopterin reductase-like flavin-dependent oxidoreductase (luciferase family)